MKYIVITPVRDEVNYIKKTIESILAQSILPLQWIIVDDGSSDGTSELLDGEIITKYSWIKVVHRDNRGYRAAGGGVMEAFYTGYELISDDNWDYIVKLDADLSFSPDYFEKCFEFFDSEPTLGIGGGTVCQLKNDKLKVDSVGDPMFHVRGATKIYRRNCWGKINPLTKAPGWDTIDEVKANYYGWNTRTFPSLNIIQHKPTGEVDGSWKNAFKNGRANYITGYHPLFMLAKCGKRIIKKPYITGSVALMAGFFSGYFNRIPQIPETQIIKYLQQQQINRLLFRSSIYS